MLAPLLAAPSCTISIANWQLLRVLLRAHGHRSCFWPTGPQAALLNSMSCRSRNSSASRFREKQGVIRIGCPQPIITRASLQHLQSLQANQRQEATRIPRPASGLQTIRRMALPERSSTPMHPQRRAYPVHAPLRVTEVVSSNGFLQTIKGVAKGGPSSLLLSLPYYPQLQIPQGTSCLYTLWRQPAFVSE